MVTQTAYKVPVGPVAAFSPWNFPAWTAIQKIAPALAAGCSIVIKAAEETPASVLLIAEALTEAGLPPDVLNVVYGHPAEISSHLIELPVIRKITFTGSIPVGRQLAAAAGRQLKRSTMELGATARLSSRTMPTSKRPQRSGLWRSTAMPGRCACHRRVSSSNVIAMINS